MAGMNINGNIHRRWSLLIGVKGNSRAAVQNNMVCSAVTHWKLSPRFA